MSSAGRTTALRAGGACVRCRKGKTKCTYDTGRPPCRNCLKGNHDCYLPSESHAHHHGQTPARNSSSTRAPRESLPASGSGPNDARQAAATSAQRHLPVQPEKLSPELLAECERVISKTFPACVAFHKPAFLQQLKNGTLEPSLVHGLLACAARSSPTLIRRYGGTSTLAADSFASKALIAINRKLDHPNLADIQALCLVIIHEWGSKNAVSAYIYLGQAARMLQMYKILEGHSSSEYAEQFLRDESFRRTLWLIYTLDCLLTCTAGRYPALNVRDTADVALPCMEMNFAFGNGVHVKTLLQELNHASVSPTRPPSGEVGEYGYIVVAATLWRDVVGMLTSSSLHNYRDDDCVELIAKIDGLRASLPMQLVDKPGQINLHMTMGSGYTYAMLHCFLHCSTIFVYRRRLLQEVTARNFDLEAFRMSPQCHDIVDRLFASSHGTMALLTSIESGSDKENFPSFPIFMLFSAFTASATIAYLSLKLLTPSNAVETASYIVNDGLRFMQDGADNWPLLASWLRHLSVMQRVLSHDPSVDYGRQDSDHRDPQSNVKDEITSNADTNPDTTMDYDQQSSSGTTSQAPATGVVSDSAPGEDVRAPTSAPRSSVGTANGGGSVGIASPEIKSPHSAATYIVPEIKHEGPSSAPNGGPAPIHGYVASPEMTAPELCQVFESQLLNLDDLAAFMGGGV